VTRQERRRPLPRGNDDGGRLLLAVMSIGLVVVGITKSSEWAGPFLIILGVVLAILFAFHSRIRGVKIFDKILLPIAAHEHDEFEAGPLESEAPRVAGKKRRTSLKEVSDAAHDPATARQRRRRAP
jgi:hypothetical protein